MNIETCCICDSPTGKAGKGEDSLYSEKGDGPYCEDCYEWKYGNLSNKLNPAEPPDRGE